MPQQFATVFVFLCLALVFAGVSFLMSWLLRPKRAHTTKQLAYECGEEPEGQSWTQFNVRFYLIALFFIIFDVEIIFMLPWAVAFNEMLQTLGPIAFWEMAIFVGILVVGLAYIWLKGDLQWIKEIEQLDEEELRPLSQVSSPEGPVDVEAGELVRS